MGRTSAIVLAAALAAAGVFAWRRWLRGQDEHVGAAPVASPEPAEADAAPAPSPTTQRIATEKGSVSGPEVREEESAQTEETRYERLVEAESEEREAAAERVRSGPLTERLQSDA